MYKRSSVYLPFKKNRTDYYIIKIDAVVGFIITTSNNWVDVEKNLVTTRVSIPVGEYDSPESILRELRLSIRNTTTIGLDISFVIDPLSRQLSARYVGTEAITFKFSPTPENSVRLALGFVSATNNFVFTQSSGNNYSLTSPSSIPTWSGPLFQEPYSGPPVSEDEEQPNNLPELFPFRAGQITQGVVKNIRKYTYDFLSSSFTEPPGEDETEPGGTLVTVPYIVNEGNTQINFNPTSPLPATRITFTVDQDIAIEKERSIRSSTPTPSYEDAPSWTGDIVDIKQRQSAYFQRSGGKTRPQFEKYNAYGQVYFSVYGSRIRALEEVRYILYKPEKPRDVLVGTYTKYFDTGRVWKIERYVNPTYSESPSAVILDSTLQGPYLEFYGNGRPRIEANFNNNFLDGAYREYYDNGLIRCQGILVNGKLGGEYTQWDEEGNRKFKAFYVNGTLDNSYALDYRL